MIIMLLCALARMLRVLIRLSIPSMRCRALLRKQMLLKWRHPLAAVLELVLPMVIIGLLVIMRKKYDTCCVGMKGPFLFESTPVYPAYRLLFDGHSFAAQHVSNTTRNPVKFTEIASRCPWLLSTGTAQSLCSNGTRCLGRSCCGSLGVSQCPRSSMMCVDDACENFCIRNYVRQYKKCDLEISAWLTFLMPVCFPDIGESVNQTLGFTPRAQLMRMLSVFTEDQAEMIVDAATAVVESDLAPNENDDTIEEWWLRSGVSDILTSFEVDVPQLARDIKKDYGLNVTKLIRWIDDTVWGKDVQKLLEMAWDTKISDSLPEWAQDVLEDNDLSTSIPELVDELPEKLRDVAKFPDMSNKTWEDWFDAMAKKIESRAEKTWNHTESIEQLVDNWMDQGSDLVSFLEDTVFDDGTTLRDMVQKLVDYGAERKARDFFMNVAKADIVRAGADIGLLLDDVHNASKIIEVFMDSDDPFVSDVFEKLKDTRADAVDVVTEWLDSASVDLQDFINHVRDAVDGIKDVEDMINNIRDEVNTTEGFVDFLFDQGKGLQSFINDDVLKEGNSIVDVLDAMVDKGGNNKAKNFLMDVRQYLLDASAEIGGIINRTLDAGQLIEDIVNKDGETRYVRDLLTELTRTRRDAVDVVAKLLNDSSIDPTEFIKEVEAAVAEIKSLEKILKDSLGNADGSPSEFVEFLFDKGEGLLNFMADDLVKDGDSVSDMVDRFIDKGKNDTLKKFFLDVRRYIVIADDNITALFDHSREANILVAGILGLDDGYAKDTFKYLQDLRADILPEMAKWLGDNAPDVQKLVKRAEEIIVATKEVERIIKVAFNGTNSTDALVDFLFGNGTGLFTFINDEVLQNGRPVGDIMDKFIEHGGTNKMRDFFMDVRQSLLDAEVEMARILNSTHDAAEVVESMLNLRDGYLKDLWKDAQDTRADLVEEVAKWLNGTALDAQEFIRKVEKAKAEVFAAEKRVKDLMDTSSGAKNLIRTLFDEGKGLLTFIEDEVLIEGNNVFDMIDKFVERGKNDSTKNFILDIKGKLLNASRDIAFVLNATRNATNILAGLSATDSYAGDLFEEFQTVRKDATDALADFLQDGSVDAQDLIRKVEDVIRERDKFADAQNVTDVFEVVLGKVNSTEKFVDFLFKEGKGLVTFINDEVLKDRYTIGDMLDAMADKSGTNKAKNFLTDLRQYLIDASKEIGGMLNRTIDAAEMIEDINKNDVTRYVKDLFIELNNTRVDAVDVVAKLLNDSAVDASEFIQRIEDAVMEIKSLEKTLREALNTTDISPSGLVEYLFDKGEGLLSFLAKDVLLEGGSVSDMMDRFIDKGRNDTLKQFFLDVKRYVVIADPNITALFDHTRDAAELVEGVLGLDDGYAKDAFEQLQELRADVIPEITKWLGNNAPNAQKLIMHAEYIIVETKEIERLLKNAFNRTNSTEALVDFLFGNGTGLSTFINDEVLQNGRPVGDMMDKFIELGGNTKMRDLFMDVRQSLLDAEEAMSRILNSTRDAAEVVESMLNLRDGYLKDLCKGAQDTRADLVEEVAKWLQDASIDSQDFIRKLEKANADAVNAEKRVKNLLDTSSGANNLIRTLFDESKGLLTFIEDEVLVEGHDVFDMIEKFVKRGKNDTTKNFILDIKYKLLNASQDVAFVLNATRNVTNFLTGIGGTEGYASDLFKELEKVRKDATEFLEDLLDDASMEAQPLIRAVENAVHEREKFSEDIKDAVTDMVESTVISTAHMDFLKDLLSKGIRLDGVPHVQFLREVMVNNPKWNITYVMERSWSYYLSSTVHDLRLIFDDTVARMENIVKDGGRNVTRIVALFMQNIDSRLDDPAADMKDYLDTLVDDIIADGTRPLTDAVSDWLADSNSTVDSLLRDFEREVAKLRSEKGKFLRDSFIDLVLAFLRDLAHDVARFVKDVVEMAKWAGLLERANEASALRRLPTESEINSWRHKFLRELDRMDNTSAVSTTRWLEGRLRNVTTLEEMVDDIREARDELKAESKTAINLRWGTVLHDVRKSEMFSNIESTVETVIAEILKLLQEYVPKAQDNKEDIIELFDDLVEFVGEYVGEEVAALFGEEDSNNRTTASRHLEDLLSQGDNVTRSWINKEVRWVIDWLEYEVKARLHEELPLWVNATEPPPVSRRRLFPIQRSPRFKRSAAYWADEWLNTHCGLVSRMTLGSQANTALQGDEAIPMDVADERRRLVEEHHSHESFLHPLLHVFASEINEVVDRARRLLMNDGSVAQDDDPIEEQAHRQRRLFNEEWREEFNPNTHDKNEILKQDGTKTRVREQSGGGKWVVTPDTAEMRKVIHYLAVEVSNSLFGVGDTTFLVNLFFAFYSEQAINDLITYMPSEEAALALYNANPKEIAGILIVTHDPVRNTYATTIRTHGFLLPDPRRVLFTPGGRFGGPRISRNYHYLRYYVSYLQDALNKALHRLHARTVVDLEEHTSGSTYRNAAVRSAKANTRLSGANALRVSVEQFPSPAYRDDPFIYVVSSMMPMLMVLSWIYPVACIVRDIVYEKERRVRSVMHISGLSNAHYWMSHIASGITMALALAFLATWSIIQGEVLKKVDFSLLFVFLLLSSLASMSFACLVSVFFSRTKVATISAGILYFVSYLPFLRFAFHEFTLSRLEKQIFALFAPTAFSIGVRIMSTYEQQDRMLTWARMSEPLLRDGRLERRVDETFNISSVMAMLAVDTVLYLVIAWYVDHLTRGVYGVAHPWYFPVQNAWQWVQRCRRARQVKNRGPVDNAGADHAVYAGDLQVYEPAAESQFTVSLRDLGKIYPNGTQAVTNVSFDLHCGQILGLLGPNGSGKSTTLAMLTGVISPSSGHIIWSSKSRNSTATSSCRTGSIGVCFQYDTLYDALTVEEHIRLFCAIKGASTRGAVDDHVERTFTEIPTLREKRAHLTKNLSGGMKRKLCLALALCGDSGVVVLDEPTSGLDAKSRRDVWNILVAARDSGRALLLSTHYMEEADALCSRIALLVGGRLRALASPLALKKHYTDGYTLTCVVSEPTVKADTAPAVMNQLLAHIQEFCPTALARQFTGGLERAFVLGESERPNFSRLFGSFGDSSVRARLALDAFSLSSSSLEDVFLNATMADSYVTLGDVGASPQKEDNSAVNESDDKTSDMTVASEGAVDGDAREEDMNAPTSDATVVSERAVGGSAKEEDMMVSTDDTTVASECAVGGDATAENMTAATDDTTVASECAAGGDAKEENKTVAIECAAGGDTREKDLTAATNNKTMTSRCAAGRDAQEEDMKRSMDGTTVARVDGDAKEEDMKASTGKKTMTSECAGGGDATEDGVKAATDDTQAVAINNLWRIQIRALIRKRRITARRDRKTWFWQLIMPMMVVIIALVIAVVQRQGYSLPLLTYSTRMFDKFALTKRHTIFINDALDNNMRRAANQYDHVVPVDDTMGRALYWNRTAMMQRSVISVSDEGPDGVVLWFQHRGYHAIPVAMDVLNRVRRERIHSANGARYESPPSITNHMHPLPKTMAFTAEEAMSDDNVLTNVAISVVLMLAWSFIPASFGLATIFDRFTKQKQLQQLSGVSAIRYWTACYICDLCTFSVLNILLIGAFQAAGLESYSGANLWAFCTLITMYALCMIPLMYCLGFLFPDPSTAYMYLIRFNMVTGTTMVLVSLTLQFYATQIPGLRLPFRVCHWVFSILTPNYCLGWGALELTGQFFRNKLERELNPDARLNTPFKAINDLLICMCIMTPIWFLMVLICDGYWKVSFRQVLARVVRSIPYARERACTITPQLTKASHCATGAYEVDEVEEDDGVMRERRESDHLAMHGTCIDPSHKAALHVRLLSRVFRNEGIFTKCSGAHLNPVMAVEDLCCVVKQGETFGLLGVNGAGKTTTMRMITGDTIPTSGDALVNGYSVVTQYDKARSNMGYCPQFDALPEKLTCTEVVQFFSALRGAPCTAQRITDQLQHMNLTPFAHVKVECLSGGNRRKLSTLVALLNSPAVVLLDEPSCGVDVASRRFLWDILTRERAKGKALILTTHSLEEASATCTRLGIMIRGKLRCIGSPEYLKQKYGTGYTVLVKTEKVAEAKRFFRDRLSSATLVEEAIGFLRYRLAVGCDLGDVFRVLESGVGTKSDGDGESSDGDGEGHTRVGFVDYAVSNTTLEDVFLRFALESPVMDTE
eukprot:GEMP01000042.1.p1 GENE.GEMP01000042.1~~GEMP01000042.1.p1  ORF type:complete len:4149 (+),score=1117.60 GEMP01000042.1:136-12582(+)